MTPEELEAQRKAQREHKDSSDLGGPPDPPPDLTIEDGAKEGEGDVELKPLNGEAAPPAEVSVAKESPTKAKKGMFGGKAVAEIKAEPPRAPTVRLVFVFHEPEDFKSSIYHMAENEAIEAVSGGIITIKNTKAPELERRIFDSFHEVSSAMGIWFENDRETCKSMGVAVKKLNVPRLEAACFDAPSALEAKNVETDKWRLTKIRYKQKFGKHVGE